MGAEQRARDHRVLQEAAARTRGHGLGCPVQCCHPCTLWESRMGSCGHSTLRSLTRIKRETRSLSLAGASLGGEVGAAQEEQAGGGGSWCVGPRRGCAEEGEKGKWLLQSPGLWGGRREPAERERLYWRGQEAGRPGGPAQGMGAQQELGWGGQHHGKRLEGAGAGVKPHQ